MTDFSEFDLRGGVTVVCYLDTSKNPCGCDPPDENYPYSASTLDYIKTSRDSILKYSRQFNVSPVAVAGSIADEYNTRRGFKALVDWAQDDVLLNHMSSFAIDLDEAVGSSSKLLNANRHDIGPGNINLQTAKDLYRGAPEGVFESSMSSSEIVDLLRTPDGTAKFAALVIADAQTKAGPYIGSYSADKAEAVLVTYYKQGPNYLQRFQASRGADPSKKLEPGEGCRVCWQRRAIMDALGIHENDIPSALPLAPSSSDPVFPRAGAGALTVSVTREFNGRRVRHAQVRLYGGAIDRLGSTGTSGFATFEDIPSGSYSVLVDKPGWEAESKQTDIAAASSQGITFALTQRLESKREVGYVAGQPRSVTLFSVGSGQYMQESAAYDFIDMIENASDDGFQLSPNEGFRTLDQQKERYATYLRGGNKAARPGYSNHQMGLSMDISGVVGYGTSAYRWLHQNASQYGFVNDVAGEHWHWTHR